MATCVGRVPNWLRTFAATTAVVVAIGLCMLLVGLTRTPGVEAVDTFQFIPRSTQPSAASCLLNPHAQPSSASTATEDSGDEPPVEPPAILPSPLVAGPEPLRIVLPDSPVGPFTWTGTAAGCRGPPA